MSVVDTAGFARLFRRTDPGPQCLNYSRLRRIASNQDETAALMQFFDRGRLNSDRLDPAFRSVARRLRAARILFVPALLSGVAMGASRLRLVDYLNHQVRQLKDEGFDAQVVDIDTGASVVANSRMIADLLNAEHRPTWLVTHSKGGLDTLAALLSYAETRRFVEGWIAFQTPFYGSPTADVACGRTNAHRIAGAALRLFQSDVQSVCDLRTDLRARFMDARANEIAALVEQVPIMCVGSTVRSMWWPTGRWMDRLGLANDGLVPAGSTVLPGAKYVMLEGLAHGEADNRSLFSRQVFEHVDLLKALLALMLNGNNKANRTAA